MELTENEQTLRQCKFLTALPVFNEAFTVGGVLDEVARYCDQILVIDDGSSDGTAEILSARDDVVVVTHPVNQGYGAALQTAFQYAADHDYDILVTIDCDGQHEPQRILKFVETCLETGADIVSGSRYLRSFSEDSPAPEQRRLINHRVTEILNQRMGFQITDAFCGFKAYRVESLFEIRLHEIGYAMPLELWVQAAYRELTVVEVAVPRIYLDKNRSFGDFLDDPATRLNYYFNVMDRAFASLPSDSKRLRSMRLG
jgi:dolichol-phosphate mannosyltransferase